MSTLTGPAILEAMKNLDIIIIPFDEKLVNPHSVDLHLGDTLSVYSQEPGSRVYGSYRTGPYLDSEKPPSLRIVPLQNVNGPYGDSRPKKLGWLLNPGVLYLGSTLEYTETRGYRPVLDGRSSTGRLGAFMHITAGYGDNGFKGHWTLEIMVVEPLILYPRQRLLQISYETLQGEQTFYGETANSSGRYQKQGQEPVASGGIENE